MPLLLAQVVLAFAASGEPVRFGVSVPERALATGLGLRGPGALQWRPLPLPVRDGRCWVELTLSGARGRVQLQLGGAGPTATHASPIDGVQFRGDACSITTAHEGDTIVTRWTFADGTEDERRRTTFTSPTERVGEIFGAGEALTVESPGLCRRCLPLLEVTRGYWLHLGLLPRDEGLAAPLRADLQRAGHSLIEAPGLRGAGDHLRSGGVVTNLEFDTTLALLRLALALDDEDLLQRARRAAFHLVDRDLDTRTGLPYAHGDGHRQSPPQPGHVWLQGLLWVGALCAEEHLLVAAGQIARSLAATPALGQGADEMARDHAWPLLELEAWLRWFDDPVVARAADRLAEVLAGRFDRRLHTFRFGEGEVGRGVYFERGWITGGIVVPALRAHLQRRPDAWLQECVDDAVAELVRQIGQGNGGLPTHWRSSADGRFAEHRAIQDPKAFLLLEALPLRELRRLLQRGSVLRALVGTPLLDDPDLATSFAMAARCSWVYR